MLREAVSEVGVAPQPAPVGATTVALTPPDVTHEPTPDDYKAVMSHWCSGVTVITARDGERVHGMVASSFTGVSIDPMTVLFCADRRTRTHAVAKAAGAFAVNILAHDQQETFRVFTGQQGDPEDRFAAEETTTAVTGAPILTRSLGWMDCRIIAEYPGGNSHSIFIGQVLAAGAPGAPSATHVESAPASASRSPMVYYQRKVRTVTDPSA